MHVYFLSVLTSEKIDSRNVHYWWHLLIMCFWAWAYFPGEGVSYLRTKMTLFVIRNTGAFKITIL